MLLELKKLFREAFWQLKNIISDVIVNRESITFTDELAVLSNCLHFVPPVEGNNPIYLGIWISNK